jgi:hypothetical protein
MEIRGSCVVLNPGASRTGAAPDVGRAVLLTGNPRGGTTFIASVAHHLGIPLGKSIPKYEDRRLRYLLLGEVPDEGHVRLEAAIRAREARHALWGWKLPGIVRHFDLVDRLVRRPVYVMAFKDPLSIAMRRTRNAGASLLPGVRGAMDLFHRMVDFAAQTERECILVSYEKAMHDPASFVRTLAEVVDIPVNETRIAEIIAAVQADSLLYDAKRDTAAS